ncbi:MAG: autotransporter-associated beta strand repeat-containing protein [Thermoguttaceae bacterium]|nr:autotransporter-associated beta strand repeat-containing protein [Thermoguttaceae bacterium]
MRKITRSFLLLLVLATLTVQARADITINDVQQFSAAPAWSDNVNITSTGQAILANNVLIGQTKDITINIASGGVLSMSSTITDNHGVNNILIPANNQSLQFTGTGTFIKLGTGAIAMQNANVTGAGGYSAKFAFDDGGLIDVQEGTLRNGGYNSQNWASNKGDLRIASGASFDVWDGAAVTVDSLVGAGTIANGTAVAKVLTIGSAGSTWSEGTPEFSGSSQESKAAYIGLNKTGAGTQIMTGTWTLGNGLTVSGGTLQFGNGGATGNLNCTSAVTIDSGATLTFNSDATSNISGKVTSSGTMNFTKGTIVLSNPDNVITGNWTVGAGATLSSASKLDITMGTIEAGASFDVNVNDAGSSETSYTSAEFKTLRDNSAGNIGICTGDGQTAKGTAVDVLAKNADLAKSGGGTFQLTGTNTDFTSKILVNGGGFSLGDGTTTAAINPGVEVEVASGAQFIYNEGAGTNTTLMNKISGDGTLTVASGTLSVTTNSPIFSATDLGNYGIHNTRFATSKVLVQNGAKLYIADHVTPSFEGKSGTITVEAAGVMEMNTTGAYNHNADNSVQAQPYTLTFDGAGTILKTGSGSMAMINRGPSGNTGAYVKIAQSTGGWIDVQEGIFLNGGWSTGINWGSNQGSLNVAANGQFSGWDGASGNVSVYIDSLTGSGKIFGANFFLGVANNAASATYGVANNTATFTGTITNDRNGTSITKRGTGTQILTGTNTYAGATNVQGGTLQIGDGTQGSITSSQVFTVAKGATLAFKTPTAHEAATLSGEGTVSLTNSGTLTVNDATQFTTGSFHVAEATDKVVASTSANRYWGTVSGNGTVQLTNATGGELDIRYAKAADNSTLALAGGGSYVVGAADSTGTLAFLDDSTVKIQNATAGHWSMKLYTDANNALGSGGHIDPNAVMGTNYSDEKTYGDAGEVYDMWQCANNTNKSDVATNWMTANYSAMSYRTLVTVTEDMTLDFSGQFDDTQGVWGRACDANGNFLDGSEWQTLLNYAGNCAANSATGVSLPAGLYIMDVRVADASGDRYAMTGVKDANGNPLGIGMRINGASSYNSMNIDETCGIVSGSDGKIIAGLINVPGVQTYENSKISIADGKTATFAVTPDDSFVTAYEIKSLNVAGQNGTLKLADTSDRSVPYTVTDLQAAGNLTIGDKTTIAELTGSVSGNFTIENGAVLNFHVSVPDTETNLQIAGDTSFNGNVTVNVFAEGELPDEATFIPLFNTESVAGMENVTPVFSVPGFVASPSFVDGQFGLMVGSTSAIPEPSTWILLLAGVGLFQLFFRQKKNVK